MANIKRFLKILWILCSEGACQLNIKHYTLNSKKIMSVQDLGISVDTVWMLLAARLVFFMQPGFALCEAGFTRSKNTANILFKNLVDF